MVKYGPLDVTSFFLRNKNHPKPGRMIGLVLFWVMCSLYAYWLWRRNAADSGNEPPAFPGALPIIGHAHLLIGDSNYLWKAIQDLTDGCIKMGGAISACIGPRTIYVLCDPDDAMTVANTCLEKDDFYEFAKPWLGEGLVTGKLSIWRNHRKLLNPAFSSVVLDGFLGVFNKQARRLVRDLEREVGRGPFDHWTYTRHNALETICHPIFSPVVLDGFLGVFNKQARRLVRDLEREVGRGPFDHWTYTRHNALETICLTALGVDFTDHTLLNREYVAATEEMFNVLVERFQNILMHNHWMYSWTRLKKKQDRLLEILHNMAYVVLQRRRSEMDGKVVEKLTEKKLGSKFKAFLDLLLELTVEKNAFTDQEIREQVDTMIVGGHDTSASVLMYTMVMIGSYPHVQERIYKELEEVFGDSDRDAEKHDLCKLVYLEAVIKESMRVIPIVPVVARKLDRNITLKNCTLSAGRTCFIFLYGVNRHPIWGEDAQEFKPERWLDPATMPDHPTAFAGFSMGRRHCIGKAYALMSMKTTLAHVMRYYRIKGDHTKLELKLDVMLKPVGGHHITIERR
ncbi:cytochrome p450 domain-containing protein [Phthorimaea operculella]|nr:cytochrome p450 domain-containing protein [Phthorimaea operculella]